MEDEPIPMEDEPIPIPADEPMDDDIEEADEGMLMVFTKRWDYSASWGRSHTPHSWPQGPPTLKPA